MAVADKPRSRESRYEAASVDGHPVEPFVSLVLGIISIAALLWYYTHNELLLYGDAVAHINIARRVIDNRSWLSSFFQLGTVWLPLQHVAMLPFVWNNRLWQTGIAGSIPSMIAYVLGGMGIFRLVNGIDSHPVANRRRQGWGTHIAHLTFWFRPSWRPRFTRSIPTCFTCRPRR